MKQPTEAMLCGRRYIDAFSEIELLEDFVWEEVLERWYIRFRICLCSECISIPSKTEWYLTIQDNYPEGNIDIYPAVENGIKDTFFHQSNNGYIEKNGLWRKGKLCLKHPLAEIVGCYTEPKEADARIGWNLSRTLEWIEKANRGTLVGDDDYFELPDMVIQNIGRIVFDEDEVSLMEWESSGNKSGTCNLIFKEKNTLYAEKFIDLKGNTCKSTVWGSGITNTCIKGEKAIWIMLEKIPVINGWQVPSTYDELMEVLIEQNVDFQSVIIPLLDRIRDGKRHYLLLGFPIPEKFNKDDYMVHWWALRLPCLTYKKTKVKGFRSNRATFIWNDLTNVFKKDDLLDWSISENRSQKQVMNRGRYSSKVSRLKYVIIGAGSIGSIIAEQLVRAGINKMLIIDGDYLEAGNIVRHALNYSYVGMNKAKALKCYLELLNCHANISVIPEHFRKETVAQLSSYDVVIDCTAQDNVLSLLQEFPSKVTLCTVSVGYKAEKIYFMYHAGGGFSASCFYERFAKFIKNDQNLLKIEALPWEGVGCWSPVFPAMGADMQLAGMIALEQLMILLERQEKGNCAIVYEKITDENGIMKSYDRIFV